MAATVRELIERQAALRPDSLYAVAADGTGELRYGELAAGSRRVAALLQRHGVAPGETVALVMANGLGTLRLLLGALWGGRCVNPVNLLSQPEQMRYVIAHSDCKLVVVAPIFERQVRALLDGLDRPVGLLVADPDAIGLQGEAEFDVAAAADAPPTPDATALLMYTSGTTGVPKGVMLSQANLTANALSIAAEHALTPADRVLGVLPLYHINAFAVTMLAPLASGGSVAMSSRFSAARFWPQALESDCTWLNVVPTIVSYLLEGDAPAPGALAGIRFCRSASAALAPEHLRGFEQKFGIGVIETMGLTETVAPAFSNPLDAAARKIGSVGRPSGCEACVIDAVLQPVPDGTTGEIAIRGPNVMRGYYKNPQATLATFTSDGWLRTGDLGHRDADGFFFITGRIKELIIKGGENIAPREIDEALQRHPAVLEAATVGVQDRHYGQDIVAYLVLRPGTSVDALGLRQHCLDQLGRYKTPRTCHVVDDLPRGPSGKVQRLKLQEIPAGRIKATLSLS
jgi:long-chain acyl-CoA synthetase